jgi:NAD(P)-dependent dehydrogenase (short-subunit alcohol dehydrogenase family)
VGADFSLTGKVAVITGASRGIGEAIARDFAERGARLVLASRKQESLEKVAGDIKSGGAEAIAVAAHTGKTDQIEALFDKAIETYGKVDVLVNNAATNPFFGRAIDASEPQYDKTFEVNTKGYFFAAKRAAHEMIKQGTGGSIINISSINGLMAPRFQGIYGMTKAAVIMMTKVLAVELAAENIRCNAICPGLTKTHFSSVFWDSEETLNMFMDRIPMGREAKPDEMVGAAVYLASDASSYATGSVIVVDGGFLA